MAYESKWLKASKALDYHIYGGPWARTHADAEYQLHMAVLDQEVLARIDGKLVTDTNIIRGKSFSNDRQHVLPFNLEVNMEDVRRIWDISEYDLADLIARKAVSAGSAEIQLENVNLNLKVLHQSVENRLAVMPLEQALAETSFRERFAEHERIHKLLADANLVPKAKLAELVSEFNSLLSSKYFWLGLEPKQKAEKSRVGRKPVYDWAVVRNHVEGLFIHNGALSSDDPDWSCQADVEREIQRFCADRFGREPAVSTVREKANQYIREFQTDVAGN